MPRRPNKLLRILLPLGLFTVGLGIPIAVVVNTQNRNAAQQLANEAARETETAPVTQGAPPEAPETAAARPKTQPETQPDAQPGTDTPTNTAAGTPTEQAESTQSEAAEQPTAPPAPLQTGTFVAESFAGDPLATDFANLGNLMLDSPFKFRVEFSHLGAGIKAIRLADELDSVKADRDFQQGIIEPEHHVLVQEQVAGAQSMLVPFCALGVEINGSLIPLVIAPGNTPAWRQVSAGVPGHFEAFILDDAGSRVLRITRHYTISPGSYNLIVRQHIENLSDGAFDIRWRQFGPIELFSDTGYGGDKRRVRFGYLFDPQLDPGQQWVEATDFLWNRRKFSGKNVEQKFPGGRIWPNERSAERNYSLVWAGMTNRYFGAVVHPIVDPTKASIDKAFAAVESISYIKLPDADSSMVMSLTSPASRLEPGAASSYDMGLYSGPLSTTVLEADPMLEALGVPGIVVYNFGGMCAFCTFAWLTGPLLGLLRFLYSLTSDYALAIILLVVCVRTVLHPITRWSQIKMQIFGKKMQNMGPKQKIIQEKYKDDKQQLQKEMGKLWREEGISPTGFLGCLPMFLQSPIWIALYATLYFAIDLRHEAAFFGVFQAISNNAWPFLADLAEPDRMIYFGAVGFKLPLVGTINSINVLPLFLGVVFYMQQKYLTPPTAAAMTPEQESQQKMMKIMMVVMFPLIMYGAPSGLSIYFITNSVLGIFESRWIRSHLEKSGRLEPDALKAKPKTGGFMAKLKAMAEERQQQQLQRGSSPKHQPRKSKDLGSTQRRYKKR